MTQALAVDNINNSLNTYKKINLAEAFKLRFKNNLSFRAIAEVFDCDPSAVYKALEPFSKLIKNSQDTSIYETNKAGILTSVQFEIVKQMVKKDKLKGASLNNLAYAASQVDNMIRLEKGQPTAITEHLDGDLSGMIDQLCGMKSAGSGSTIDVTPSAAPVDILASLEAPIESIPTQAPTAGRSTTGNSEGTISPVQPAKPAKQRKPRIIKPAKSATSSRKQNACNITSTLDSKVSTTKEGTSAAPAADTLPSQSKEWYD